MRKSLIALLRKLVVIVAGAALLVLWQNFLGVRVEGSMASRTAYMIGVILFSLVIFKRGN